MKPAWLGSIAVHVALAGGLLWCAVAQPPVVEIGSIDAVTVSLVDGPPEPAEAGAPASPAPAVTPHIEPMRVVTSRHDAPPTRPLRVEAPADVAESDLPAPSGPEHETPVDTVTAASMATADVGSTEQGSTGGAVRTSTDPWPAYYAAVRDAVERVRRYPFSARLAGLEDRVKVTFRITADGSVEQIVVTEASRFPVLNEAALDTVRRAARFPAPPLLDGQSGVRVTVPLAFTLHHREEASPH